jgi:hypothetical protein
MELAIIWISTAPWNIAALDIFCYDGFSVTIWFKFVETSLDRASPISVRYQPEVTVDYVKILSVSIHDFEPNQLKKIR